MRLDKRIKVSALALLLLLLLPFPASSQVSDPFAGIVAIVTVGTQTNKGAGWGTGFLVSPDGTVLTDSHIIYRAIHDPMRYRLLVISGGEFYAGTVVCSTVLRGYVSGSSNNTPQRDLAVIRLSPSDFPFPVWTFERGNPALTFHAHTGPLPTLPTLKLADHSPTKGLAVHARGWGGEANAPAQVVSYGYVDHLVRLSSDGTQVFAITQRAPAEHGMSGDAILDAQEQVVGILFWGPNRGGKGLLWGIDVSELHRPCGEVRL
jgi:S1-C subfamily serine protease